MNFEQKENISILDAQPEDAIGIQQLTIEASEGMYKLCGWNKEDITKHFLNGKRGDGATRLKNAIETFGKSDILIVSKNETGKIIGCCFAEIQEDRNRIEAMYVDEQYQGKGLARTLFDNVYGRLDISKDTYLDVFSLNSRGVNFYKKLGFVETGKKFFDEKYSNGERMSLEITEMILTKTQERTS